MSKQEIAMWLSVLVGMCTTILITYITFDWIRKNAPSMIMIGGSATAIISVFIGRLLYTAIVGKTK